MKTKTVNIEGEEVPTTVRIGDYKLVMTCAQWPEQYDCYNKAGEKVGYFRLRSGCFTVECPDCGVTRSTGIGVYPMLSVDWFHPVEREMWLSVGVLNVRLWEAMR